MTPAGAELVGRQFADALGDQLEAGAVEADRRAAVLIGVIAKGGRKASLFEVELQAVRRQTK